MQKGRFVKIAELTLISVTLQIKFTFPTVAKKPEMIWFLTASPTSAGFHLPVYCTWDHRPLSIPRIAKLVSTVEQLCWHLMTLFFIYFGQVWFRPTWALEWVPCDLSGTQGYGACRSFHGPLHVCLPIFQGGCETVCHCLWILMNYETFHCESL